MKLSKLVRTCGSLKCSVIQSDTLDDAQSGLVILNHGFGASGDDLVDIGAMLMDESEVIAAKFRFVFPEAPIDLGPMGMRGGRAWWPINMAQLAEMGAVIAPIVPAFYTKPKTLDDIINHTIGRLLDLFDIDTGSVKRWTDSGVEKS